MEAVSFRQILSACRPTLRYWMETEVHVYAFSIAANVLLSFFPFLIVSVSIASALFHERSVVVAAIDFAMRDYFPDELGSFLSRNLPARRAPEALSIFLLLFTANGIFEPLEVALNRVWGIAKNRSFLRNQLISLCLIFGCGGLALLSLIFGGLQQQSAQVVPAAAWVMSLLFKMASLPLVVLALFLVYKFLPNGPIPADRTLTAAIGIGVTLEVMKYLVRWLWPPMHRKLQGEYGPFVNSATLILIAFLSALLVLAGAEWAAREIGRAHV